MAISTCSSGLQVFLSPATRSSSSSSVANSYRSSAPISLPTSGGLKIEYRSRSSSVSSSSKKPRVFRQRPGVVCEAQETAIDLPAVDDATFDTLVLKAAEPVLVDFWAPWCGPCRMIDPVVGKIAQQYAGKLKVYKINTDESPKVANQYGVRSIPTIMIFVNGEKKDAIIGAVPESTLTASIEKFLPM